MGRWAKTVHLASLNLMSDVEVTALCSRRQESLEEAAALCPHRPRLFTEAEQLAAWDGADAVIVATPNDSHERLTALFLEHGKHVLCEKPLALTVEGCRSLVALAAKMGLVLQVGYELRYAPPFDLGRRLLDSGEIGEPRLVWCALLRDFMPKSGWRSSREQSGGVLLEITSHYLDLVDFFAADTPQEISAYGGGHFGDDVDYCWAVIRYARGAVGSIGSCMFGPADKEIALSVVTTEARLDMSIDERTVKLHRRGKAEPEVTVIPPGHSKAEFGHWGSYEQLLDWLACIRDNRKPRSSGASGLRAVQLALALQESVRKGAPVALGE